MLPRPSRPHDQLLRPAAPPLQISPLVIAGIGGFILGHILWLAGISLATKSSSVSTMVLVVSAVFVFASAAVGYLAWLKYQRGQLVWATFLGCLPISPIIFTVIVLGVTYL